MKRTLTLAVLTGILAATMAVVGVAGVSAQVASTSEGCTALNSPAWDAQGDDVSGFVDGVFWAGERVVVTFDFFPDDAIGAYAVLNIRVGGVGGNPFLPLLPAEDGFLEYTFDGGESGAFWNGFTEEGVVAVTVSCESAPTSSTTSSTTTTTEATTTVPPTVAPTSIVSSTVAETTTIPEVETDIPNGDTTKSAMPVLVAVGFLALVGATIRARRLER